MSEVATRTKPTYVSGRSVNEDVSMASPISVQINHAEQIIRSNSPLPHVQFFPFSYSFVE